MLPWNCQKGRPNCTGRSRGTIYIYEFDETISCSEAAKKSPLSHFFTHSVKPKHQPDAVIEPTKLNYSLYYFFPDEKHDVVYPNDFSRRHVIKNNISECKRSEKLCNAIGRDYDRTLVVTQYLGRGFTQRIARFTGGGDITIFLLTH